MIEIDGSHGEGGGQIIRSAATLSMITGTAFRVTKVRAGRSKPGLKAQHTAAVLAAARLCGAQTQGVEVGSQSFSFTPGCDPEPGAYHFDIGTAGSAVLVAQTIMPALALLEGESRVTIRGGTHVPFAPTADYLTHVWIPLLAEFGWNLKCDMPRAGYFPKGGGQLDLTMEGNSRPRPIRLTERSKRVYLTAQVTTSGLNNEVAERGIGEIERRMRAVGREIEVTHARLDSPGIGAAVTIAAHAQGTAAGFSALGEKGKPMERVASEPCEAFMKWWKSGACVDERLADQLVVPAVLADGESVWTTPRNTEHLQTVFWLTNQFMPIQWTIDEELGSGYRVRLIRIA